MSGMGGNMSVKRKKLYFIEGNISSGKSTLVDMLKSRGHAVFDEPVNEWTSKYIECDGENILQKFYDNMARWSFQFEVAIMTTRYKRLMEALASNAEVVFLERSLWTDRKCFAQNLYEEGNMTKLEWTIYCEWFDTFMEATSYVLRGVDVFYIHLHTEPDECHRRMLERARKEEKGVPLDYLKLLDNKHREWLSGDWHHQVLVINGHQGPEEVMKDVETILLANH